MKVIDERAKEIRARCNAATPEEFHDVSFERGRWLLFWESIGEGVSGDFDPNDPDDRLHLRATLHFDGEPVEDGSYCTLATEETPKERLQAFAADLLNLLPAELSGFSRNAMQTWTWRTR